MRTDRPWNLLPPAPVSRTAALLLLALLAAACGGDIEEFKHSDRESERGMTLQGIEARSYLDEFEESRINAERGVVDIEEKSIAMDQVRVRFLTDTGTSNLLHSDAGLLYLEDRPELGFAKNDLLLTGGVRFESERGLAIEAPQLRYLRESDKLVSGGGWFRKEVRLEDGRLQVTGKYFEAKRDMSDVVDHDARVRRLPPAPGRPAAALPQNGDQP